MRMQRPSARPRQLTFATLSCVALAIASMALMANLVHLQSLTATSLADDWDGHHFAMLPQSSRKRLSAVDEGQAVDQKSQEVFLRELLSRSIVSLEACSSKQGWHGDEQQQAAHRIAMAAALSNTNTNRTTLYKTRSTAVNSTHLSVGEEVLYLNSSLHKSSLRRFGFVNDLTQHLATIPVVATSIASSSSSLPSPFCPIPPDNACKNKEYTMLVTTEGHDWRTVFLNLLSWLSYPHLSRILILLLIRRDDNDRGTAFATIGSLDSTLILEKDAKYGHRLLQWHADPKHKVSLILNPHESFWKGLEHVYSNYTTSRKDTALLVWNGDVLYEGNSKGVQSGWNLWKRHAQSLVATTGWRVLMKQSQSSLRDQQHASNTTDEKENELPVCLDDTDILSVEDASRNPVGMHLPQWNGLYLHRDWLCWLRHPIGSSLRHYISSLSLADEKLMISVWLTHLSAAPPKIYPPTVLRNGTALIPATTTIYRSTTATETLTEESGHVTMGRYTHFTQDLHGDTRTSFEAFPNATTAARNATKIHKAKNARQKTNTTFAKEAAKQRNATKPYKTETRSTSTTKQIATRMSKNGERVAGDSRRPTTTTKRTKIQPQRQATEKQRRRLEDLPLEYAGLAIENKALTAVFRYLASVSVGAEDWCSQHPTTRIMGEQTCEIPWMSKSGQDHDMC